MTKTKPHIVFLDSSTVDLGDLASSHRLRDTPTHGKNVIHSPTSWLIAIL